jgi:hypothetical protein
MDYPFGADGTWTTNEEHGTYTYDDYTKNLVVSDHAVEHLEVFSGGLVWYNGRSFYWPSSDMGDWGCDRTR